MSPFTLPRHAHESASLSAEKAQHPRPRFATAPGLALFPTLLPLLLLTLFGTTPPAVRAQTAPAAPPDGMPLRSVPAGPFRMGAEGEGARPDEGPVREVWLSAYRIDAHEVTVGQFAAFVAATGHRSQAEVQGYSHGYVGEAYQRLAGAWWRDPDGDGRILGPAAERLPVTAVSWDDAAAYCRWAGRRLPSEAEWEKAARGTDGRVWPWGMALPRADLANLADARTALPWRERDLDDGHAQAAPVGSYPLGAGPYGAYDLAGNVWEWVADWYAPDYARSAPRQDPPGPASGSEHVQRGGGFSDDRGAIRAARRSKDDAQHSSTDGGFRCAVSAPALERRAWLPYLSQGESLRTPRPATFTPTPRPSATPRPSPTATPSPDPCQGWAEAFDSLDIQGERESQTGDGHPNMNLAVRGWQPVDEALAFQNYGADVDLVQPPRLLELIDRAPVFRSTHRVYDWNGVHPYRRERPITDWPVTLLGLAAQPGDPLRAPSSGRPVSPEHAVLVHYAAPDRVTLQYTRDDISSKGYTLHVDQICVDPSLVALYRQLDAAGRGRLPALRPRQTFGRARADQVLVAIRDSGRFMDPRSRRDWWDWYPPLAAGR